MGKKRDLAWETVYEPFANLAKGRTKTNPAQDRTAIIESMLTRILTEMSVNRFKWTGLEGTGVNVRFMELTLFRFGLAVTFQQSETGKVIALQGAPSGPLNWAQEPTRYTVSGNLIGSATLAKKDVVPVWSNYMRIPDVDIVYVYAQRIAELDRTIEINTKSARRPRIAFVNENQRLSVDNINRQIDEGQSIIPVNADLYTEGSLANVIQAVDMGIDPDMLEKLHILRTRLWGECMGYLGFDFANQDKKERLVASEVDANNSQVDAMRAVNLNARKQAADEMNIKWGLNVDVEYHVTSETSAAAPTIGDQPTSADIPLHDSSES